MVYPFKSEEIGKESSFEIGYHCFRTHLLDKYGYTIKYIEADGIDILESINPILEEGFELSEERNGKSHF